MVVTLYYLPSWFVSPDDKPSYQLFQSVLQNPSALASELAGATIKTPNLKTIVVQSAWTSNSDQPTNTLKYNYVQWENRWYIIRNISFKSAQSSTIEITAEIDVYLSFMVTYFDEGSTNTTPVYFKQKHLNRFMYYDGKPYAMYSQQFYLLNMHPALRNVGSKKVKSVVYPITNYYQAMTVPTSDWSGSAKGFYAGTVYPTSTEVYPVVCWKMTAGENDIQGTSTYPFPFGLSPLGAYRSNLNWWQLLKYVSSDYYVDVVMFPLPLHYYMNDDVKQVESWTCVYDVIGKEASNQIVQAQGTEHGYQPANDYALTGGINRLTAIANVKHSTLNDCTGLEPFLMNFCDVNIRMYGQDCQVDLTAFDGYEGGADTDSLLSNDTVQSYFLSHVITISPPHFSLTNVSMVSWPNLTANYSFNPKFTCWNYNPFNDTVFMVDMKCVVPSVSNNWNNYLAQHSMQYDVGLNISSLMAQNEQQKVTIASNLAGGMEASLINPLGDLTKLLAGNFTTNVARAINEQINAQSIAPNNYHMANDKLMYLETGMKKDYTRTSNLRNASMTAINTLFDSNFVNVYEYPVLYETTVVINYCALYGYILERWDAWKFWNNRTYCNFVKCANWSKALVNNLTGAYFNACEKIMEQGVRVWNNAVGDVNAYNGVPFNQVLVNHNDAYQNAELNYNNDEITWLNSW